MIKIMEILDNKFTKIHSVKDIITSITFLIIGALLVALFTETTLQLIGYLFIPIGVIFMFTLKSDYKNKENNLVFLKKEYYLPADSKNKLLAAISTNPADADINIDIDKFNNGNAIRLAIYCNKEIDKAYLQLFEYIPYTYEPCSEIFEYKTSKIKNLIK